MGVNDFLDRMYWQERVGSALNELEWRQRQGEMTEQSAYLHSKSVDFLAKRAETDNFIADLKEQQMMRSLLRQSGKSAIDLTKIVPTLPVYPATYPVLASFETQQEETESSD